MGDSTITKKPTDTMQFELTLPLYEAVDLHLPGIGYDAFTTSEVFPGIDLWANWMQPTSEKTAVGFRLGLGLRNFGSTVSEKGALHSKAQHAPTYTGNATFDDNEATAGRVVCESDDLLACSEEAPDATIDKDGDGIPDEDLGAKVGPGDFDDTGKPYHWELWRVAISGGLKLVYAPHPSVDLTYQPVLQIVYDNFSSSSVLPITSDGPRQKPTWALGVGIQPLAIGATWKPVRSFTNTSLPVLEDLGVSLGINGGGTISALSCEEVDGNGGDTKMSTMSNFAVNLGIGYFPGAEEVRESDEARNHRLANDELDSIATWLTTYRAEYEDRINDNYENSFTKAFASAKTSNNSQTIEELKRVATNNLSYLLQRQVRVNEIQQNNPELSGKANPLAGHITAVVEAYRQFIGNLEGLRTTVAAAPPPAAPVPAGRTVKIGEVFSMNGQNLKVERTFAGTKIRESQMDSHSVLVVSTEDGSVILAGTEIQVKVGSLTRNFTALNAESSAVKINASSELLQFSERGSAKQPPYDIPVGATLQAGTDIVNVEPINVTLLEEMAVMHIEIKPSNGKVSITPTDGKGVLLPSQTLLLRIVHAGKPTEYAFKLKDYGVTDADGSKNEVTIQLTRNQFRQGDTVTLGNRNGEGDSASDSWQTNPVQFKTYNEPANDDDDAASVPGGD